MVDKSPTLWKRKLKNMKTRKKRLLAARIERYWLKIQKEKEEGRQLLAVGCPYSSEELVALNQRFSRHCVSVMRLQKEYGEMMEAG